MKVKLEIMCFLPAVILAARSLEPKVAHTWVASIGNGTMSGIKYSHMVSVATRAADHYKPRNDLACDVHTDLLTPPLLLLNRYTFVSLECIFHGRQQLQTLEVGALLLRSRQRHR